MREMKWFEIWFDDKQAIINTMIRNMSADLDAGYDYFGYSIAKQREAIDDYKRDFDDQVERFKYMEDSVVNRWCYYDLKKRGAIC